MEAASDRVQEVEPLARIRYQMHPWELLDLPVVVWQRYVQALLAELQLMDAQARQLASPSAGVTVQQVDAPASEEDHRRRLRGLSGYREV